MLFQVEMDVRIPAALDTAEAARLKSEEKARFQELQRSGKWRHIWRVAGHYKNVSIFDVESNAELHDLLTSLPLYPFMAMRVTALCRHPSSLGLAGCRDLDLNAYRRRRSVRASILPARRHSCSRGGRLDASIISQDAGQMNSSLDGAS